METLTSIVKAIWIADDDPDDLNVFKEALEEIYPSAQLTALRNGDDLLEKLSLLPAPDLLFLDLNMPCSGYDCIKAIRSHAELHTLPIVVYTSSFRDLDITYSYGLGANLYIRKPTTYAGLLQTLRKALELDWGNPKQITSNQVVAGIYVPFTAL